MIRLLVQRVRRALVNIAAHRVDRCAQIERVQNRGASYPKLAIEVRVVVTPSQLERLEHLENLLAVVDDHLSSSEKRARAPRQLLAQHVLAVRHDASHVRTGGSESAAYTMRARNTS